MAFNQEKCHFMCIAKNVTDSELLNFNEQSLRNCKEVEILGVTLDRNLNFRFHTKGLCRKVDQNLSSLLRVSSYIQTNKKGLLYK